MNHRVQLTESKHTQRHNHTQAQERAHAYTATVLQCLIKEEKSIILIFMRPTVRLPG